MNQAQASSATCSTDPTMPLSTANKRLITDPSRRLASLKQPPHSRFNSYFFFHVPGLHCVDHLARPISVSNAKRDSYSHQTPHYSPFSRCRQIRSRFSHAFFYRANSLGKTPFDVSVTSLIQKTLALKRPGCIRSVNSALECRLGPYQTVTPRAQHHEKLSYF